MGSIFLSFSEFRPAKLLNQNQPHRLQADGGKDKHPAFFALEHDIKVITVKANHRAYKEKGQHRHDETLHAPLQGKRADSIF
jgi:hypothetical protein